MISDILNRIVRWVPALLSLVVAFVSIFPASLERLEDDIAFQQERIAQLEQAYAKGEMPKINENDIFAGDLAAELENGIKFNEMSFLGTHNSYQTEALKETKKLHQSLSALSLGIYDAERIEFKSETLTEQLNCGLRSFEMDIETFDRDGEISFTCMHSPYFEMTTSCYDFSLALKEIAMWSDNNPNHLPITIIIEPKETFLPLEDMTYFNLDYALSLDGTLRECLGEKLFTPADMLRDYSSFGDMRAADDWCEVKDMLGKVVILLHECNVTESYISVDSSIKTQAMFPMLREDDIDRSCASIILCNKPAELIEVSEDIIDNKKIMVRTRADKFGDVSEVKREQAFASGANIISTDYPVRTDLSFGDYVVTFDNGKTVGKNRMQ